MPSLISRWPRPWTNARGTKVLLGKHAYTTWGDVEAACDY